MHVTFEAEHEYEMDWKDRSTAFKNDIEFIPLYYRVKGNVPWHEKFKTKGGKDHDLW